MQICDGIGTKKGGKIMKHKIVQRFLVGVLLVSLFFSSGIIEAKAQSTQKFYKWNILHEQKKTDIMTKGVTYEMNRRFTDIGWFDIHVMKIDLTVPEIYMNVMDAKQGYGLKETVKTLVESSGAVGGINGDFFSMKGTPTDSLGIIMKNGALQSTYNQANGSKDELGGLFIDKMGNAFIDFYKTKFSFYNENKVSLTISGINKIMNFNTPVRIDRNAFTSTQELDKRFPGLYKIVVEDEQIISIGQPKQNVIIPETGYIIAMNEERALQVLHHFQVGQKAYFDIESSIDPTRIQMGIGGGGTIVKAGQIVNTGLVVDGNKRHPRTAVGVSKDKKQVILLAVDGRSHSLGATHAELGHLLLQYGAYDAMHLDGGGSTTMAGRGLGESQIRLYNKPSDSSPRKVVNGIGVFSNAPAGSLHGIKLTVDHSRVFVNAGSKVSVSGFDEYFNPIAIPTEQIIWEASGIQGKWEQNVFYPETIGSGQLTVKVGEMIQTAPILSMPPPVAVQLATQTIRIDSNGKMPLRLNGMSQDGFKSPIDPRTVQWSIDPSIGRVEDGVLIAGATAGQGILEGTLGNTKFYAEVIVSQRTLSVTSFEQEMNLYATVHPSYVENAIQYSAVNKYEGSKSLELRYRFRDIEETQAAYIDFKENAMTIPANPTSIGLWVHGNQSGHWLRGRIVDAQGNPYNIDFAGVIDWKGWKYTNAKIPVEVVYPIMIDRLYVTALKNTIEEEQIIFIDHMSAVYPKTEVKILEVPKGTVYKDPLQMQLPKGTDSNSFDITVFGKTAFKNRPMNSAGEKEMIKNMTESAQLGIFTGETDIKTQGIKMPFVRWSNKYEISDFKNIRVIQLATDKGGIRATDATQWNKLRRDLVNAKQDHIFITTNKSPVNRQEFTDLQEAELLHTILKESQQTGKSIFVMTGSDLETAVVVKEGIRYVQIKGLVDQKGAIHTDLSIMRFRIQDKKIVYDIQPVSKK